MLLESDDYILRILGEGEKIEEKSNSQIIEKFSRKSPTTLKKM